jgi:hypothetical protein
VRRRRVGDSELRAVPIIEALGRHGVRYIVVGSYAAIAQGVDLAMTDLDIVPATNDDNLALLVAALKSLHALEQVGDQVHDLSELSEDPSTLTDTTFRVFETDFGRLDVLFRPAGFPRGYEDLVSKVVVVRLHDDADRGRIVEAFMASKAAVYASKRAAGRKKDADALAKFEGIHPADLRKTTRDRYRAAPARRDTRPPSARDPDGGSEADRSPAH